jgi:hypothetical protein
MVSAVTDPGLLAQLEGGGAAPPSPSGQAVSDPSIISQLDAPSPSPGSPKAPESAAAFAIDKFKQGTANFLGLAGAPVSLMATATEVLGITPKGQKPVGGMAQVTRGWEELLGVKKLQAPKDIYGGDSKSNEYIGTISEFMGGSIVPGAGAVAGATRKLATAVISTLGTVASGASAVEGKEVGERLAPTFGLKPEIGGQIGSNLASLAGPKMIGLAGQSILKSVNIAGEQLAKAGVTGSSAEAQKAAANSILMKEITTSLSHAPQSEANVARAIELKKKVDNFSPNLAQMTGAPGLVATYKEVANKSPEALAKASQAEQRNLTAIATYKEKVFPKSGQSVTDPARIKLSSDATVLDFTLDRAKRELRSLTDQFRRTVDNEAVGKQLREKYWSARSTAKIGVDIDLANVYGTARKYNITEDMTDMRDAVNKIVSADRTTFQDMPPTFAKILQEYPAGTAATVARKAITPIGASKPLYRSITTPGTAGKSEASFEEVHSLYKQANKDWADATAAGNSSKAFYMKAVKDQLEQKVAKYNSPQYGELASKFTTYNKRYSDYAHTFREGAGGEIAKRTRSGIATDAEDIVSKVILQAGDKKRGVQDFFQVYGSDPSAAKLLHDGVMDNFSKAVIRSGTYNPAAGKAWLARHETAMNELPELKKLLGNSQKIGEELINRQLMAQAQRKVLDRTVLAKIARNEQPEALVQRAIADPKTMKGLLVGALTDDSKQAIARAIADSVGKMPNSFEFLKANAASLKPVMDRLGKNHWGNLNDIAEMEQISARTKAPTAIELQKLQDIGEQTIGTSVKGMFSRLRNLDKPMGVSKEYMVLDVGGRFFYKVRSEELARLREHAMFDADTAEVLAKLGQKSVYTKKDLMDLQRISFGAGVNSIAQAVGEQRDGGR